jgi:hypothetical protein
VPTFVEADALPQTDPPLKRPLSLVLKLPSLSQSKQQLKIHYLRLHYKDKPVNAVYFEKYATHTNKKFLSSEYSL